MRNYALGFRFSTRHTTHLIVSSKRVGNLVVITPTKKGNCSLRFKALVFLDFGVIHLSNYKMFLLQKVQRRICIGTMLCVFFILFVFLLKLYIHPCLQSHIFGKVEHVPRHRQDW